MRVDTLLEFSDIKDRALAYTPEQIAPVLADMRRVRVHRPGDGPAPPGKRRPGVPRL